MNDNLASARDAVQRAGDATDDATVREQLRSIDEGLMEMTESEEAPEGEASTTGDHPHGDALEEIEAKLASLAGELDRPARERVEDARDHIDAYRRTYTRDW